MENHITHIEQKLLRYKIKALKVKIVKGILLWVLLFIGLFLLTTITEWVGELSVLYRTVLVGLFTLISLLLFVYFIAIPILKLIKADRTIPNDIAARKIGKYFPLISDKLLNFLELTQQHTHSNSLTLASLNQRAKTLEKIDFSAAIDSNEPKRTSKFFIPLIIAIIALLVIAPKSFLSSSERIINFRKEYTPEAPFQFIVISPLSAYQNEDYTLQINLIGGSIPSELVLLDGSSSIKMSKKQLGRFSLQFSKLQATKTFRLNAAGYTSQEFTINTVARPSMSKLLAKINFPDYLKRLPELIDPAGELELPEGSSVYWLLGTQHTESALFYYNKDTATLTGNNGQFTTTQLIKESGLYGFQLSSGVAKQNGKIEYSITTIKDEYPTIAVQSFEDTLLYKSISIGGEIADDYGISKLLLVYTKQGKAPTTVKLPYNKYISNQQIYFNWRLDTLGIEAGEELSYYIQVFDNDGVNGQKSARSQNFSLTLPTKQEQSKKLDNAANSEKDNIKDAHKKASDLQQKLNETLENIKSKKELSWKDKQNIKELLKEKEKLNKKIKDLKKQNELLNLQRNELQKPSKELEQKAKQLQNLMNELLDEETKKLYEELQKLLEDQAEADKVQSMLNDIQNKEINLEEEMERTLELFKRLQVEQNLEKLTQDLNELAEKQDSLASSTKDKNNTIEDLKKEQEEIEKEFDNIKEKLEETKEQNNELKRPESFEDTSGEEEDINKEISESKENLDKKNRKKSSQNQKKSGNNMKKLAKKLEQMQEGMQMEQMQEDVNNLRAILENLITLSYTQEKVMVDFRAVNQSNPQFVTLSEEQLKIKDNSKIIKDSLLSLASRVMSISSFVTRELNEMDAQLNKSTKAIKDRKKAEASKYQQFSMTSMNNLALMLDNVLQQMQESMADAMGKGKGDKKQPMPGMSELQEQLNKEIRELQKSGKSGKELSQELAKLAAQQEMIRKALREAEEKLGNKPGGKEGNKPGNLGNLQKQMEQTELDLVNKNLSRDLQRRQQQILTRLLEAEKALREQEMELKRESTSATQYEKELPRAFEEYLKQKEKEIELIKTIPPKLHPYYKKEVNEYFNRLKNIDN